VLLAYLVVVFWRRFWQSRLPPNVPPETIKRAAMVLTIFVRHKFVAEAVFLENFQYDRKKSALVGRFFVVTNLSKM